MGLYERVSYIDMYAENAYKTEWLLAVVNLENFDQNLYLAILVSGLNLVVAEKFWQLILQGALQSRIAFILIWQKTFHSVWHHDCAKAKILVWPKGRWDPFAWNLLELKLIVAQIHCDQICLGFNYSVFISGQRFLKNKNSTTKWKRNPNSNDWPPRQPITISSLAAGPPVAVFFPEGALSKWKMYN